MSQPTLNKQQQARQDLKDAVVNAFYLEADCAKVKIKRSRKQRKLEEEDFLNVLVKP